METEVFHTLYYLIIIEDSGQILICDRHLFHVVSDLGCAGSCDRIVGLDQDGVVIVEQERILDTGLGCHVEDAAQSRIIVRFFVL